MKLLILLALGATLAVVSSTKLPNPWRKISLQDALMLQAWSFVLPRIYGEAQLNQKKESLKLFDAYRKVHSVKAQFRVHYSIHNKATGKVSRGLGWCQSILEEAVPIHGSVNYTLNNFNSSPPNPPNYVLCSP